MSCWVVPSVAAELWGCSVEHVMWCIREGTVVSKVDGEFLVLDVFPDSGKPPESKSRQDQPPTFVEVIPEDSKIPADLLAPADIAERRAIRESVGRTRRSPGHN